jgi:tetratricopeptide (TPR) repeat protein
MGTLRRGPAIAAALLVAALLPARAAGEPAGGVRWFSGSFEQALAAAREQKKLVLLDAWAAWCKYCHVMDTEVWAKDDVGRALVPEVIAVRAEVDIVKGTGLQLRDRYQVEGLPLVLVIDPADGKALERLEGYRRAPEILEAVDRARVAAGGGRAATEAAAATGDPAELLRVAGQLRRSGEIAGARAAAEQALAADPACAKDAGDEAALLLADLDIAASQPAAALARLSAVAKPCAASSGAGEIWDRTIELAGTVDGDAARGAALIRRAEAYPDDPDAQRAAAAWLVRSAKDPKRAAPFAARALALAPDDPRAMAAVAEVELAQGNVARARELIERAIRIDPHDPDLRELRLRITMAARS